MLLAGIFGKKNISDLDLEIIFPEEIYAKKETFIKLKIINKKKYFPAFLIRVIIEDYKISLLSIYFEKEKTFTFSILPEERGFKYLKEIYLASVFPFNFFVRSKKLNKEFPYLVFPEPKKCNLFTYFGKKSKGEKDSEKIGSEGDLLSIKDYIEGTPIKYIHWKATAKTDKLKIKQLSDFSTQPFIIDLTKLNILNKEDKLSCATYLILEAIKKGIPVGLKTETKFYQPNLSHKHKLVLLTELALYE